MRDSSEVLIFALWHSGSFAERPLPESPSAAKPSAREALIGPTRNGRSDVTWQYGMTPKLVVLERNSHYALP
jgi:hypothetical protein